MSAATVPMIGIVGGIGSGKSTLTNALQQIFRCHRLDADQAGHRVLRRAEIKQKLIERFGKEIMESGGENGTAGARIGEIRRSSLAALVFGESDEQRRNRKSLEQIVHPAIHQDLLDERQAHLDAQDCDLLLLDAALLLEAGWAELCDAVIFLDVPKCIRLERVKERGWTEEELDRREASQLSLEQKRNAADFILDQSGSLDDSVSRLANWISLRFPQLERLSVASP